MAKSSRYEGETFGKTNKHIAKKKRRQVATVSLRAHTLTPTTWDDEWELDDAEDWYDDLAEFEPIRKDRS